MANQDQRSQNAMNLPPEVWSEAAEREAIRQEGCGEKIDVCESKEPKSERKSA
jgi:hypothetical protein